MLCPSGFEEFEDAGFYACGYKLNAFALAADEVSHEQTEAAGVQVGDIGEVEDVDGRHMVRRIGFKDVPQGRGGREEYMSRAVKGPEKRKIKLSAAGSCLGSMVKVEPFQI